ncbi:tumor necrosis factor receptor superfamily member 5-like [Takifugu rubripes]|uniref:tumor necrosis factor receptor superfamily member 5-like n=1 Tax=Takifugu rubripes TaxID=31033 RepID=UPI0011459BD2|nr:tumor necrosis factor receptor superfamily member 5-like [Takifugu rubripes]
MGLVQCFLISCSTLMALSFPPREVTQYHIINRRSCKMCPAGEYQKTCTECAPCPAGSYTTRQNREDRCSSCSRDCRPNFHLKVIQNCTDKSDVKCVCEEGYMCTQEVPFSANCRYCERIPETDTVEAATILSENHRKETPTSFSGRNRAAGELCNSHKCGPQSFLATQNDTNSQTDKMNGLLPSTVTFLFAGAFVALVVLGYIGRLQIQSCFKRAVAVLMLCNKGGRKAPCKLKESTHHFPRDSFSAQQQPLPLPAANLGPVHVHNPGTIIFSLLSQFTGQVGPTIEDRSTAERETGDERDCPVFQPAPSPSIHISEEERSRESDSIFFPFQEQGKDCHISKEEVL